jgi:hypothetical protein
MKRNPNRARTGAAAMWTMLVIAVVTVMMAATFAQFTSARRQVDAYQQRIQCEWLARTGYEIAVAKVLTDPNGYVGETLTPIANGEIKIVVRRDPENRDVYHVTSEASYPLGAKQGHKMSIRRSFKRFAGPDGDRIEHTPQPE